MKTAKKKSTQYHAQVVANFAAEPSMYIMTVHFQNLVETYGRDKVDQFYLEVIYRDQVKRAKKAA